VNLKLPPKVELPQMYVRFVSDNRLTGRRGWIIAAVAAVLVLVVGFVGAKMLFGNKEDDSTKKAAVLTVDTTPVATITAERSLEVSGAIWAAEPISIGSEIMGLRVVSVNAEEGQFVRKGQVLATLNSSILRAQLAREEARLKSMMASYSKAKQPNRTYEISAIKSAYEQAKAVISQEEANIRRAKANLTNAQAFSRRFTLLAKQGAVSDQDAETRQANELVAEAELHNAEQRLEAAKAAALQAKERMDMFVVGGRQEDVEMAAANVAETQANIQQIQSQIDQTIIRAPAHGLITKRDVHVGEIGNTMQMRALFQMVADNKLEVRAQVPETDLPRLHEGQSVTFTGPGEKTFDGHISIIVPQVDPDTRLATLRIAIPFSRDYHPGMFVHGKVKLAAEQVTAIPTKAVVSRDDYNFVFTLDGDKVMARNVRLGDRFGEMIEVTSGLKLGEPVVVSGAGFLKDGDIVRVVSQR
jgi:HlyD family secretion protein